MFPLSNSVDVIIPTYNEAIRLATAVKSVLAQSTPVQKS
jgi:glycosyltransferase involved in cell wall biosynthesis